MSSIKAFICCSGKDGEFAQKFNQSLINYIGFETFLFTDNLKLSDDWVKRIWKELVNCDFFIPLISNNFYDSFFANQEVGVALGTGKKIIPISLDGADPKGMIYSRQAYKCSQLIWNDLEFITSATEIYNLPLKAPNFSTFQQQAIDGLIQALKDSKSYKTSGIIIKIIQETANYVNLSEKQLGAIKKAALENIEVYGSDFYFPYLRKFLQEKYNILIDK